MTIGAPLWKTSTYSGTNGGQCVEVAVRDADVLIRDSKYLRDPANDPHAQPVISVPVDLWLRVLDLALSTMSGAVDGVLSIVVQADGSAAVRSGDVALSFTPAEWDAFVKGIADGEFAAA